MVRNVALSMLATASGWLIVSIIALSGTFSKPADRAAVFPVPITFAAIALAPSGLVFAMFRSARG
ncbi:MAG: hypothetical protein ABI968_01520 [Acidobacteriota bacterium]